MSRAARGAAAPPIPPCRKSARSGSRDAPWRRRVLVARGWGGLFVQPAGLEDRVDRRRRVLARADRRRGGGAGGRVVSGAAGRAWRPGLGGPDVQRHRLAGGLRLPPAGVERGVAGGDDPAPPEGPTRPPGPRHDPPPPPPP